MSKKIKKIFLILAGGTCILDKQGNLLYVESKKDIDNWLDQMPELNILADIKPIFISGEDNELGKSEWKKMVSVILKEQSRADGFVVVSKIDQLINTSLALNFCLQNFKKTIVLTSSRVSGSSFINKKEVIDTLKNKQGGLTLRSNLINAIQIAQRPLPAPAIFFGTYLIPASKAIVNLSDEINVFSSIDNDYWGKVDFGINVKSDLNYNKQQSRVYNNLLADILVIEDMPGVPWHFDSDFLSKYRGIFVDVCLYQSLEKSKKDQIIKWNKPTVLYNYRLRSSVGKSIAVSNCTRNAALIKTMWALSNPSKNISFEKLMLRNVSGEFLI